jgi:hypothetical protein
VNSPQKKMLDAGCWMLGVGPLPSIQHPASNIQHLYRHGILREFAKKRKCWNVERRVRWAKVKKIKMIKNKNLSGNIDQVRV